MAFFLGSRHIGLAFTLHSLHSSYSLTHPLITYMMSMSFCRTKVSQGPHLTTLLDRLRRLENDCPSPERAVHVHAAQELDIIFTVLSEFAETRDMLHAFLWINMVSDQTDFISLLQTPKPSQEALVIWTYFCMISQRLPTPWWSQRWAQGLRNRTLEMLDEEHKTWVVELQFWDG